ncbi:MAG: transketolase family protein [Mogibacterium sp.]|nr:transketolase family protein [Mogibacterium sp.]MBR2540022.1 transketolase family protein [Mogibacterium sp.]
MAKKIATRQAYGEFLVEYGAERKDLIVMSADLSGSNKTDGFEKAYPDRFVEAGISEQDMYAEATGIAHSGHVVAASTFAMFAAGRSYEIIRNSIAHTHANVKICATHGGITVGEDGASHQTFEDLALMRVIPDMTVLCPADAVSTKILMRQEFDKNGPAYIRLGRSGVPVIYDEDADITIGKGNLLRKGSDVAIIATGIMVAAALEAADKLAEEGIDARVIDMHTIKPIDEDIILEAAFECGKIVTCEEHSVIGGLGSAVCEVTAAKCPCPVRMVGQKDVFGESGTPGELLKKYGMTADDIAEAARTI